MIKPTDRDFFRRLLDTPLAFFQQYPLLFWGTVWSVTLFLIWIALASLMNPPVSEVSRQPDTVTSTPLVQTAANSQSMHFWMFSILILGCAVGCLLILQRLAQPSEGNKASKRLKRHSKANRALVKPTTPRVQAPTVTTAHGYRAKDLPSGAAIPQQRSLQRVTPAAASRSPVVTVVPAEESHPLDWGEAGLAEMMDIRKRRPRPTAIR